MKLEIVLEISPEKNFFKKKMESLYSALSRQS